MMRVKSRVGFTQFSPEKAYRGTPGNPILAPHTAVHYDLGGARSMASLETDAGSRPLSIAELASRDFPITPRSPRVLIPWG
jgi:hypothetical protein